MMGCGDGVIYFADVEQILPKSASAIKKVRIQGSVQNSVHFIFNVISKEVTRTTSYETIL